MGEVYRARDPRLGRDVAVKVLPAHYLTDPDRLERFHREARAAAALNHPNIVAIYDTGTSDGVPFIASELLTGTTLREALTTGIAWPTRKALDVTQQMARGLAAAHTRGIVHRDLKPENVFLGTDGVVKILDFGLARLKEGPVLPAAEEPTMPGTEAGRVLGTVGYMAPEQARGQPADHRADLFSFGAVLYEMLAGRRAFTGDTAADTMTAILTKEPPEIADASPPRPPRARAHRDALPRQTARGTVPVGQRPRLCARIHEQHVVDRARRARARRSTPDAPAVASRHSRSRCRSRSGRGGPRSSCLRTNCSAARNVPRHRAPFGTRDSRNVRSDLIAGRSSNGLCCIRKRRRPALDRIA